MLRQLNKLSDRKVKTAAPGKYSDGGNLWLVVEDSGSRHWVFRYTRVGHETSLGLGSYPITSLAEARQAAFDYRTLLAKDVDPLTRKRELANHASGIPTFKQAADDYIDKHKTGWSNEKHVAQWRNTLESYAMPKLGERRISEVSTADVLEVLKPIWSSKSETARRVRQRIEAILDAEAAIGHRQGENPARWRGHLSKLLPAPEKVRAVKHFPALRYKDAPSFMRALRERSDMSAKALEFLILTAARTSMVIRATWSEIDGDVWNVPASRMKARRAFRVPLSRAATKLLKAIPRDGEIIFWGPRKPQLSSAAMDALLQRRMGFEQITVHGFRSTFSDWASEATNFPADVREMALAHAVKDKVEAAYRRDDLLPKRRELMEAWAAYLGLNKGPRGHVFPTPLEAPVTPREL